MSRALQVIICTAVLIENFMLEKYHLLLATIVVAQNCEIYPAKLTESFTLVQNRKGILWFWTTAWFRKRALHAKLGTKMSD